MNPILQEIETSHSPETLALALRRAGLPGLILLRTGTFDTPASRYSFVAADPFVRFRSTGSRCEVWTDAEPRVSFGDPWHVLDSLMARYELLDEMDLPFPLGGCFGFWGYDLKNFSEPRLPRHAPNDLEMPDCHVGFYDSLVAFDHALGEMLGYQHRRLRRWQPLASEGRRENGVLAADTSESSAEPGFPRAKRPASGKTFAR